MLVKLDFYFYIMRHLSFKKLIKTSIIIIEEKEIIIIENKEIKYSSKISILILLRISLNPSL